MAERLRDVKRQLEQVTAAVKLHLKVLRDKQNAFQQAEDKSQVSALVTSIKQTQSELQNSTTEILNLATKWLDVVPQNGEETETEDEMEIRELEEKIMALSENVGDSQSLWDVEWTEDEVQSDTQVTVKTEVAVDAKSTEKEDEQLELRIAIKKCWEKTWNNLASKGLFVYLQSGECTMESARQLSNAVAIVASGVLGRGPVVNSRLQIEHMITAFESILDATHKPEVIRSLAPVRGCIRQMQQYCDDNFPDYVEDMVNEIKTMELLQRKKELDL